LPEREPPVIVGVETAVEMNLVQREMIQYSAAKQQIITQYQATVEEKLAQTCTPFRAQPPFDRSLAEPNWG
jgi:hypothetical protein